MDLPMCSLRISWALSSPAWECTLPFMVPTFLGLSESWDTAWVLYYAPILFHPYWNNIHYKVNWKFLWKAMTITCVGMTRG